MSCDLICLWLAPGSWVRLDRKAVYASFAFVSSFVLVFKADVGRARLMAKFCLMSVTCALSSPWTGEF